jgi:hypothetical protein
MYCWPGIYQTNKDRLSNPNLIYPGQGLRIPGKCDTQSPPVVTTVTATVAYQPRHALAAATAAQNYSGGGGTSFQECVIRTESGGNPDVWNASGHWGLYQFSESTWVEYGGPASEFGSASVAEQNQVFDNAMATPGGAENWSPYDGC